MSLPRIAVVGTGPTGIYAFGRLIESRAPLDLTLVEAQERAGWGTPYAPGMNDEEMLANIASVEIPPVTETLVAFLQRQDDAELLRIGVPRERIDARAFYPRLVLGEYFGAQMARLIERAGTAGHRVTVLTRTRVTDAALQDADVRLTVERVGAEEGESGGEGLDAFMAFDRVVMATGHDAHASTETHPLRFASPYPTAELARVPAVHVGIRGTSLSGIDAMVAVATAHGGFLRDAAGTLLYHPRAGSEGFRVTMMSRKGLLPEADFFFPIPYDDNLVLTDAAVDALVAQGRPDLLDATFELFREELMLADPDWCASIGLAGLDADSFGAAYWGLRDRKDPLRWAGINLAESVANYEREHVVPWRYAILRTHETVARIVPHLAPSDLERFNRGWKGTFVDDYATVPHESIERVLAMANAGRLDILKVGGRHRVEDREPAGAVVTKEDGERLEFGAFVEATGQRALSLEDLPFPTLLAQGAVRAARVRVERPFETDEGVVEEVEGIDLDDAFRPVSEGGLHAGLHLLALPFLLHRMPFAQGITVAQELGEAVAEAILRDETGAEEGPSLDLGMGGVVRPSGLILAAQ